MPSWLHRFLHRDQMETQLDKEMRFHLEQHSADLIARGHDPAEAGRIARLELGGPEQVKEECRDARGTRWLEDFVQDVRYAVRSLRQRPGFALVALLTLALGIGATTVMFTVCDGVLLKPLPFYQPERLVRVHGYSSSWKVGLFGDQNVAYPDFLDCQRESRTLAIGGSLYDFATMKSPGDPQRVVQMSISSNLYAVLGVHALLGRGFLADEDRAGAAPVAILDYIMWQRRFASRSDILGTAVVLDNQPYTIVGVAPRNFHFEDGGEFGIVYTPLGQNPSPILKRRGPHPIGTFARLQPGATLSQAAAELDAIGHRLAAQYPETNKDRTFIARQVRPDVGDARSILWLLLGAVGLVLLIACANIASLMLARAVSRERELAMRVALGAGRGRLARQCLTESAVLAVAGGALGVMLAAFGLRPFIDFWPGALPRAEEVHLDWTVLLFALAVSLISGLLFGLAPALRAPARSLEQSLRAGSKTIAGSSRRLHGIFVVAEIALAMVLLACAGVLGRTLVRLASLDPGVNIHNVLTARTALSPATLNDPGRTRAAWTDLLDRARHVPGVEAVAMVDTVPMREGSNQVPYRTSAAAIPENRQPMVLANSVTPDYLKVTGIPLRRGRFLTDLDRQGTESVAVIDEVMAQQAFPNQDPIGKQLWIGIADPVTVVGVVGHVRQWGLAADDQAQVRAQLYYPFAQVPDRLVRRWSELMSIAVRTSVDPLTILDSLRREIRGATGDQVLSEVNTFEQLAGASLARQRFLLLLFSVFAGLALLLASIGIYGVLAYLTGQRVPEIGVRMALGATAAEVMWLVLRQSLAMVGVGAAIGIIASVAAARVMQNLVEGMRFAEPSTFAIMILVLLAAAMIASFLPARRASRIDPIKALRQE
jgi:predicted permease